MDPSNTMTVNISNLYDEVRLPNARTWIRLLDLRPARTKDARLEGRIRAVEIDRAKYEALSYVWGSHEAKGSIIINGKFEVSITRNLETALRRLRRKFLWRTLWVDALCINQGDTSKDGEKSNQVRIMGRTYQTATCVDVWLGESETARSVFLKPLFRKHAYGMTSYYVDWRSYFLSGSFASDFVSGYNSLEGFWRKMRHSESCPRNEERTLEWHTRAWTTQELIKARRAKFYLGNACVKWSAHWNHTGYHYDSEEIFDQVARRCGLAYDDCLSMRRRLHASGWQDPKSITTVFEMLFLQNMGQASDERDKVYSLLSLIDPDEAKLIPADYSEGTTKEAVFALATFASMQIRGITETLSRIQFNVQRNQSLPSWSLDFSNIEMWVKRENSSGSRPDPDIFGVLLPTQMPKLEYEEEPAPYKSILHDPLTARLSVSGFALDVVAMVSCKHTSHSSRSGQRDCSNDHDGSNDRPNQAIQSTERDTEIPTLLRHAHEVSCETRYSLLYCLEETGRSHPWSERLDLEGRFEPLSVSNAAALSANCMEPLGLYTYDLSSKLEYLAHANSSHCCFITSHGLCGLAPGLAQPGDLLVHVPGASMDWPHSMLVVLRKQGCYWKFRGLSYVPAWNDEFESERYIEFPESFAGYKQEFTII